MLGRDMHGKPLYAGDVAIYIASPNCGVESRRHSGSQVTVVGPVSMVVRWRLREIGLDPSDFVAVDHPNCQGAMMSRLKKIRSGKQPTTTWEEIANTTGGWKPVITEDEKEAA